MALRKHTPTASITPAVRSNLRIDFTTASGKHLRVLVPLATFDDLSLHLGNGYKAGCWVAARCREVESLSDFTIEKYVNMLIDTKLGRGSNRVSFLQTRVQTAQSLAAAPKGDG